MIAYKKNTKQEKKASSPPPFIQYLPIAIGVFLAVFLAYNWRDYVVQRQDGSYVVHPERKDEAEREKEKLEDCQTYKLIARESGWYMCYLCRRGVCYLNAGEVWKYGMSCSPETRYKPDWLQQMNLKYVPVFNGSWEECRVLEIELIRDYPIHPENLKRPQSLRLPIPPGHKSIKMK
ncbi:MAG: hypothetical protein KDD10_20445 [Phaeodactylibacter sp.]|nr:hypothetical protein [Phaeodactylibacter sp.]MCB9296460.1 hypothetical protein [Lewinellaceae bacterium]